MHNLRWLMRAMVRLGLGGFYALNALLVKATLSRRYTITDDYEPSTLAFSGAV